MIGCVNHRISVVDLVLFLLLLIAPHQQKTLTTSAADPSNVTQCVLQDNDRGINFGCPMNSMIWVRVGFYGRSPSTSPSQFCENPTASASDCIPDPRGDRRLIGAWCNTFTYALADKKTYNDIVTLCPSNNGGFPYGYISFECLPRMQTDGINYIPTVNPADNSVYRDFYGKTYFVTSGYPNSLTTRNAQFQVSVDGNTKVTIRLLDAFGRLLDATGPCPYTLYLYSSVTNIYREWCVNRTSWTVDDNTAVFPAALPQGSGSGSQSIDVVFTKTNANQDAEGAFWMVVEAVNVVDNSPARNVTISCGSSFVSQGRPTTTTTTTTSTTTTPTTTTTTPTTTTPTTTTPTTTTPTTTTPTTTTPTTTTPTTTTPTTTTTTTTTTSTTTIATTTPTTTTSTTTTRTTPTTTATTSTERTTPTSTTSTTTSVPSLASATLPTVTSSSATSSSVTSTTQALSSNNATEPGVSLPTMTSNPTSRPTSGEGAGLNNTSPEKSSQNTNVIIGVVVAVVGVIIIIVIIVVVAVICRRNPDRKSKPRPSLMAGVVSPIPFHSNNNDDYGDATAAAAAYKNSSSLRQHGGRDHIYDEIHEPSMGVMTVSYPPQQHHPAVASPTIRRGQSHKASNGVKVRFMTPGGDEDLVFYPGVSSNVSDDDKANRQTAQNANEVHPRLLNDFSSSKRLSFTGRQDSSSSTSVPSKAAGDPNTGIQLNPVYGYRPADIYMY